MEILTWIVIIFMFSLPPLIPLVIGILIGKYLEKRKKK